MLKKILTYALFVVVLGFIFKGCSPDRSGEANPSRSNNTALSRHFHKGNFISFAHPTFGIAKTRTLSLELLKNK